MLCFAAGLLPPSTDIHECQVLSRIWEYSSLLVFKITKCGFRCHRVLLSSGNSVKDARCRGWISDKARNIQFCLPLFLDCVQSYCKDQSQLVTNADHLLCAAFAVISGMVVHIKVVTRMIHCALSPIYRCTFSSVCERFFLLQTTSCDSLSKVHLTAEGTTALLSKTNYPINRNSLISSLPTVATQSTLLSQWLPRRILQHP